MENNNNTNNYQQYSEMHQQEQDQQNNQNLFAIQGANGPRRANEADEPEQQDLDQNPNDFQEREGTDQNQQPHASMQPQNLLGVQQPGMAAAQMDGQEAQNNDDDESNLSQDNVGAEEKPELNMAKMLTPFIQGINRAPMSNPSCNFENHVILMKGITWSRDSHGLFDYESRHLTKKTLKAEKPVMISRSNNDISLFQYNEKESFCEQISLSVNQPDDKALLKIVNQNNTFYLESSTHQHHEKDLSQIQAAGGISSLNLEQMYLVVRSLKHNNEKIDYEIQERDILKIGRVKFAVKEIGYSIDSQQMEVDTNKEEKVERGHSANSVFTQINDEEYEDFEEVQAIMDEGSSQVEESERRCRFCWTSNADTSNPLLVYCWCDGSVKYIHFVCLQQWLNTLRQEKTSSNFSTYFWKAFECEICKKPYPLMMKANKTKYNLVKYEKPKSDYMVLESLSQEKNTSRIIHIIRPSATKNIFKLGRGHESDLRINDISVSRCHAKIKLVNGKFMLEDNTSKFGTLVLVKQRTPLLPQYNKAVQVGRTVINFSVKTNNGQSSVAAADQLKHKTKELAQERAQQEVPQEVATPNPSNPALAAMAETNGFANVAAVNGCAQEPSVQNMAVFNHHPPLAHQNTQFINDDAVSANKAVNTRQADEEIAAMFGFDNNKATSIQAAGAMSHVPMQSQPAQPQPQAQQPFGTGMPSSSANSANPTGPINYNGIQIDPAYLTNNMNDEMGPKVLETLQKGGQLTEEMQIYLAMRASLQNEEQQTDKNKPSDNGENQQ